MKELTDEMVQKSIDNFAISWLIILVILLIISVVFICLIFALKRYLEKEVIEKRIKNLKKNILGLRIATVLFAILEICCLFTYVSANKNKNNWRVETNTITDLSQYTRYDSNDVAYQVYNAKIGDYSGKVEISKKKYYSLEIGDTVYVAVTNNSRPVNIWSTDDYIYTGDHFE